VSATAAAVARERARLRMVRRFRLRQRPLDVRKDAPELCECQRLPSACECRRLFGAAR
jgi:hypothetical protein